MTPAEQIAAIILGEEPTAVRLSVENHNAADFAEAAFLALAKRGVAVVEVRDGVTVATFDPHGRRTAADHGNVAFLRQGER